MIWIIMVDMRQPVATVKGFMAVEKVMMHVDVYDIYISGIVFIHVFMNEIIDVSMTVGNEYRC